MRCLTCGADSLVKDTRPFLIYFVKRTRECFNEHKFTTLEVPPSICNLVNMRTRMKRMPAHIARWRAHNKIRHSTLPTKELMRLTGLSEPQVRRIRASSRDS